jgi:hypothetical protein
LKFSPVILAAMSAFAVLANPATSTASNPATVDLQTFLGLSTTGVSAAAARLMLFGDLDASTRYFAEGVGEGSGGRESDALSASYPYRNRFSLGEGYLERSLTAQRLTIRLGRYFTPFGVPGESEGSYLGFTRLPLVRYYDNGGVPDSWLEEGADILIGAPSLQLELGASVPADSVDRRRAGLVGVGRLQSYRGNLIFGLSFLSTPATQSRAWSRRSEYAAADAEWASGPAQFRGEWIIGSPGMRFSGWHLDAILHFPAFERITWLGRLERLDVPSESYDLAGPQSGTRATAGLRIRATASLAVQANVIVGQGSEDRNPAIDLGIVEDLRW